ncbi:MAG TPA: hypothetical protein VMT20_05865 [Terriglobia bacterium]|nr:hypothetical protein [Terriglobia bacterium]
MPGLADPWQGLSCYPRVIPDPRAARDDLVRIIDESREDYLYPKSHFVFVDFPPAVKKRLIAIESAA